MSLSARRFAKSLVFMSSPSFARVRDPLHFREHPPHGLRCPGPWNKNPLNLYAFADVDSELTFQCRCVAPASLKGRLGRKFVPAIRRPTIGRCRCPDTAKDKSLAFRRRPQRYNACPPRPCSRCTYSCPYRSNRGSCRGSGAIAPRWLRGSWIYRCASVRRPGCYLYHGHEDLNEMACPLL